MEYGLIGEKLGHSFSKPIHEQLGGYPYQLYPLPTVQQARAFLMKKEFRAINITIPYKTLAMEYCDEIDARAQAIGAVNTMVNRNGMLYGFNTDFDGFLYLARHHGVSFQNKTVFILGTGGTQSTVEAVANAEGAKKIIHVSRTAKEGAITYAQAAQYGEVQIIINTTPAGMYPNNGTCLLDISKQTGLEAVFDVVYNPFETALLQQAQAKGILAIGGLRMLVAQAKYAAEYFTDTKIKDAEIETIYQTLYEKQANLVLIGMPSCGKTSLGQLLAEMLQKPFVDLDKELETQAGKQIHEILNTQTETVFRDLESRVTAQFAKEGGQVISTGGGVVLRAKNVAALRQNGVVIYIDRPLELLIPGGDRPLSQSTDALAQQYKLRAPLYQAACHSKVENKGDINQVAQAVKESFYEVLNRERT